MRMWSRGLGRSNIGLKFDNSAVVMTVKEVLGTMPEEAQRLLLEEIDTGRVIAVSGKMMPPVGWEYAIVFELKDIFALACKMIRPKIWHLFFGNIKAFKKDSIEIQPIEERVLKGELKDGK